jgi:hypothetical protein
MNKKKLSKVYCGLAFLVLFFFIVLIPSDASAIGFEKYRE